MSNPAGTVRWSSPPLGLGKVINIIQSRKVDETTPDFYVQEKEAGPFGSGALKFTLRAMTAAGRQQWVRPGNELAIAGDNEGGVLAQSFDPGGGLVAVNKDGAERWRSFAHVIRPDAKHAIHPDGTIFVATVDDALEHAWLTGLNGATGQEKLSVALPSTTVTSRSNTQSYYNSADNTSHTYCADSVTTQTNSLVPDMGGIVIDENGTAWLPLAWSEEDFSFKCVSQPEFIPVPDTCTLDAKGNVTCVPNPPIHNVDAEGHLFIDYQASTSTYAYSAMLGVARATPEGGAVQTLNTLSQPGYSPNQPRFSVTEAIIPDGQGGVWFGGYNQDKAPVIFGASGVQRHKSPRRGVETSYRVRN